MGKIVIVVYRPLPGKETDLERLVRDHVSTLQEEDLVTSRAPVIMRASDGCIVEVFEWISADAIAKAHNNPNVNLLWEKFNTVCTYEKPVNLTEFHTVFSEFESIN